MVGTSTQEQTMRIALLVVLLSIAFLARVWPLYTSYWWDEAVYLQNAETMLGQRDNYDELEFRPPLLSLLISLTFLVYHHMFAASVLVAVLGTLGVLFMYLLGKELYGPSHRPCRSSAVLVLPVPGGGLAMDHH